METTIQRYEGRDLEALVTLWHDTKRAAFPYVPVMQAHTLDDDRRYFNQAVLAESEVWVARCLNAAGGSSARLGAFVAVRSGWIDQLFVAVDLQRRGLGTALLEHARSLSPHELRLFTFQNNTGARAFYERHGFETVRFGVSPPPESEPDVEYLWRPPA